MLKIKLAAFLVISLVMVSFASSADSTAKSVTMTDFKKEIKSGKPIIILDVRMPEELTGPFGKIDGAVNIPLQELESRIHELDKYKGREIRVISRSGIPSKLAAEILRKHGFEAANVLGGMMAYRQGGQ